MFRHHVFVATTGNTYTNHRWYYSRCWMVKRGLQQILLYQNRYGILPRVDSLVG